MGQQLVVSMLASFPEFKIETPASLKRLHTIAVVPLPFEML